MVTKTTTKKTVAKKPATKVTATKVTAKKAPAKKSVIKNRKNSQSAKLVIETLAQDIRDKNIATHNDYFKDVKPTVRELLDTHEFSNSWTGFRGSGWVLIVLLATVVAIVATYYVLPIFVALDDLIMYAILGGIGLAGFLTSVILKALSKKAYAKWQSKIGSFPQKCMNQYLGEKYNFEMKDIYIENLDVDLWNNEERMLQEVTDTLVPNYLYSRNHKNLIRCHNGEMTFESRNIHEEYRQFIDSWICTNANGIFELNDQEYNFFNFATCYKLIREQNMAVDTVGHDEKSAQFKMGYGGIIVKFNSKRAKREFGMIISNELKVPVAPEYENHCANEWFDDLDFTYRFKVYTLNDALKSEITSVLKEEVVHNIYEETSWLPGYILTVKNNGECTLVIYAPEMEKIPFTITSIHDFGRNEMYRGNTQKLPTYLMDTACHIINTMQKNKVI